MKKIFFTLLMVLGLVSYGFAQGGAQAYINKHMKTDPNFKNAIIQSIIVELPEFGKDITEMIIEEEFGNDYYGNLIIKNYPNLEKIVVKKKSLQNIKSLKICNCEKLKSIEIEEGEKQFEKNEWYMNNAFCNVRKLIMESN